MTIDIHVELTKLFKNLNRKFEVNKCDTNTKKNKLLYNSHKSIRGPIYQKHYFGKYSITCYNIYIYEQIIWAKFEYKYVIYVLSSIRIFPNDINLLITKFLGFNQVKWNDKIKFNLIN